jgi:hypothetical protein
MKSSLGRVSAEEPARRGYSTTVHLEDHDADVELEEARKKEADFAGKGTHLHGPAEGRNMVHKANEKRTIRSSQNQHQT